MDELEDRPPELDLAKRGAGDSAGGGGRERGAGGGGERKGGGVGLSTNSGGTAGTDRGLLRYPPCATNLSMQRVRLAAESTSPTETGRPVGVSTLSSHTSFIPCHHLGPRSQHTQSKR